jgi:hypothetical protein
LNVSGSVAKNAGREETTDLGQTLCSGHAVGREAIGAG